MALEQKLSLKLSQRLVMTPSLQQAIKLLQMTKMELETVVAQELEGNPVLEEQEPDDDETPAEKQELEKEAAGEEFQELDLSGRTGANEETSFEAWIADTWNEADGGRGEWEPREASPLENTLTREPDLYDHVLWQIHLSDFSPRECEIAEQIVGNLDPNGFLVASVAEICALGSARDEEPWTEAEVQAGIERVADAGATDFIAADFAADADERGRTRELLRSLL